MSFLHLMQEIHHTAFMSISIRLEVVIFKLSIKRHVCILIFWARVTFLDHVFTNFLRIKISSFVYTARLHIFNIRLYFTKSKRYVYNDAQHLIDINYFFIRAMKKCLVSTSLGNIKLCKIDQIPNNYTKTRIASVRLIFIARFYLS